MSSSDLRDLVERGEEFDVRLSEVDQLWRTIEMREWSVQAKHVLEWTTTDGMENDDEFLSRERWKADDILRYSVPSFCSAHYFMHVRHLHI
ncbi:hypothetical protein ANCDUO_02757 [Ancylostoma duodenale]|uniref:Lysine-specific demethylase-like domain-containing protein n=1 Tax=Ancylostoma duodenale TaxID=51022 RepID=A0A0C2H5W4_9BILA|nr:hypothetical protein ANCDUO_02757 [Ancylostoma duodenale]